MIDDDLSLDRCIGLHFCERIVAREECGCSRRIGSVQKDSAVSAVAAWGTHPFSTPLCPPRRYHLKDREKDVQEEWRRGRTKEWDFPEGVKSKGFRAGQDTSLPEARSRRRDDGSGQVANIADGTDHAQC
jgi:hypothetical protein